MTGSKRTEQLLEERLRFETLLAELSVHFINLPAERIDGEIEDAQRRICELLDIDRSTLWRVSEGSPGNLLLTNLYQPPDILTPPDRMNARDFFPWTVQKVLGGETVTISKMTDLPPEADRDRESFCAYNTKSGVYIPLSVGEGSVFGLLTFAVLGEERNWPETVVMGFKLIAQVFANTLARKQTEQTLRNRLRFEHMVSNLSARFMATPLDQVDSEIDNALRQILVFFEVDRCALLELQKDKVFARITHAAFGEGIEPISGEINLAELFPWCYEHLVQGEHINICRVEDYPEDALRDRQSHAAMGIKSALIIPVAVDGRISRTIVINHTRRHQTWPEEYIPQLRLLGDVFVNALERMENRLKLEDQLRFEMLLVEISGRFVNLPADQVDDEIVDAQRRVCESLGLDLSALWQWSMEPPRILTMTHLFRPPEGPPVPEPMYLHEYFPWYLQQMLAGRIVAFSSLEELPAEAARDRESCLLFGIKSNLTIPLSVGDGPTIGILGLNTMQAERDWPDLLVRRLQLVAQIFANALARKRADQALRESEARLSMTTDAVGAGLWILEVDTEKVWVSPKSRDLFHFAPDEEIHYESYFRVIHPEDRDRVNQEVQQALRSGEKLICDYQIIQPDGAIRWIATRGQRFLKSTGEPERMMGLSLDITESKQMEEQLREHLHEIEKLKQRLETENIYLHEEIKLLVEHKDIVGQSVAMKRVLTQAEQVAQSDSTVLLLGETGTGKDLLARAIHGMSLRKDRPLVTVNCASLPPTLIESELFGREKGAYTGAMTRMMGRFEVADGSTLFLDEIGELPLDLQSKLLRVLEDGTFERLGSTRPVHVNVRIIAATNRDIEQAVKDGKFRPDLFYRLNVFPIVIPPLRKRPEDIPLLVRAVVKEFQMRMGKEIESIPKKTMQALQSYSWPGNVRELRNVIEHAMIVSNKKNLDVQVPQGTATETDATGNFQDMERTHIVAVLEKTGWRLAGKGGAAEVLGMKRTTLQAKMKKLGIKRPIG
jgi:formate hydrogenlyase transcriptional activator